MSGIDRNKYITFKREDGARGEFSEWFFDEDKELLDAVVLRKRDRLAVGALQAYANQCAAAAQLLLDAGHKDQAMVLFDLADYMHGEATDAEVHARRLPTI